MCFYKRSSIVLLALLSALCSFLLTACGKEARNDFVVADGNTVAIFPDSEILVLDGNTTLADYLAAMEEKGLIEFEAENGMLVSVNGLANEYTGANGMKCWMLYTSDPDHSNKAFGQLEYEGKKYSSASLGIEGLIVKVGYAYFLAYHTVTW